MKVCMEEKKKWLGQSNYSQAAFLSQGNLAVWHESNSTKHTTHYCWYKRIF